ncbi:MAG: SDR family oxidoreductase [Salinibacterium sp.]|nr:SDR family oxidoreductase [Salinibacterium sp.]
MTITAIITGGAHGIGAATARLLASTTQHHIVIADIDEPGAAAMAAELITSGRSAEAAVLDVADTASWRALRKHCDATGQRVGVIVNNAYTITRGPSHELDDEVWNRQIDVLLGGVHRSIRAFHDHLEQGGAIVNVASVHAIAGWAGHSAYAAAKGGVLALTRQLAVEYGPAVRVNAVIPGAIETRAWDGLIDDEDRKALNATIVAQRFGTPEEVASAIVFLAGDGASYITGASLVIDGGLTIRA